MYVFLRLNGLVIEAEEADVVRVVLAFAAGYLDELGLPVVA
jgi:prophage maintenance system killer protein